MRPAASLSLACLAALAVAGAVTWPLALHLGEAAPRSTFTGGHVAALSIATHVPPWSTHTELAGWPGGADFRPLLWPSIVLAHLFGALAAYNLTILLIPSLNVLGGWALGRVLFAENRSALLLGALLAFPPWVRTTLQNGQPEQAILGLAAAILALSVWSTKGTPWRMLLVAPAVALGGISAPHVVLAGLGVLGVWAVAGARAEPRRLAVLALAAGGASVVAAYHAPGFDRSFAHFFAPFGLIDATVGPTPKRAARFVDLFFQTRLPPGREPWVVHLAYIGPPLAVAAALGAARSRWAVAAGLVLVVLAFGESGPYGLLTPFSTTLAASGTPYRFIAGAVLAFSIAAARTRWAPLVVVFSLVESVLVDPRALPFALTEMPQDTPNEGVAGVRGAVLDVPLVSQACREAAAHYLAEAGRSGRPSPLLLRSGVSAWGADPARLKALEAAFSAPDCATRLPPLLADFAVVTAHDHGDCLLQESHRACLTAILGAGTTVGDSTAWAIPSP